MRCPRTSRYRGIQKSEVDIPVTGMQGLLTHVSRTSFLRPPARRVAEGAIDVHCCHARGMKDRTKRNVYINQPQVGEVDVVYSAEESFPLSPGQKAQSHPFKSRSIHRTDLSTGSVRSEHHCSEPGEWHFQLIPSLGARPQRGL